MGCGLLLFLFIMGGVIWAALFSPSNKQTTTSTQIILWSGEEEDDVVPLSMLQKGAHIRAYGTSDDEEWERISEYTDGTSQAEWVLFDHITDASVKETRYVSARKLNVRAAPTTEAETREPLEQGEEVTIFETTPDGWARISPLEGVPGDRTARWVFTEYLSPERVKPPKPAPAPKPAPTKREVSVLDVISGACRGLIDQGIVIECDYDINMTTANWVVVRGHVSVSEAGPVCQAVVTGMRRLAEKFKAKALGEWQVRVYTPFTGDHPVATCWLYR